MSELLKTILLTPAGGAFKLEIRKDANIFSDYQLCSIIPIEEVAVIASSIYTLSIGEIRLPVSPAIATPALYLVQNQEKVASPTSAYSLATAPT